LLELFAGHGQNRFYRELEEWLSSITRLSFSSGEGEMTPDMGMAGIALDQMSEQIERLQEMFARSDSTRADVDDRLGKLADSVERLAERIEATSPSAHAMTRVAEGQEQLVQALQDRAASGQGGGDGMDAESRMRLRSIDVQMLRILEEISAGRQESMAELRTELGALTRALNNAARGAQMPVEPATRLNLKDPSATRKED
jgi:chromosome segregation ATPase